jgi:hypothetical protein
LLGERELSILSEGKGLTEGFSDCSCWNSSTEASVLSRVLKSRSQSVPFDISGSNTICNGACIVSCCSHYKFLHIDPYCCKFVIDSYAFLVVDIMIFFSMSWNKTTLISTIPDCFSRISNAIFHYVKYIFDFLILGNLWSWISNAIFHYV